MAVVDKEFREWMESFKAANPWLIDPGMSNMVRAAILDAAQYAFSAGRKADKKAARYDWLAQGGIYRIGFDSTGGVSLEQWDGVIDELMDREDGR